MKATDEQIAAAIAEYTREHGYSPSIRDLNGMLGYSSTGSTRTRLIAMRNKGMIDYEDGKPRTIVVRDNHADQRA